MVLGVTVLSYFCPCEKKVSRFGTYLCNRLNGKGVIGTFGFGERCPRFLFPKGARFIAPSSRTMRIRDRSLLSATGPLSCVDACETVHS